MLFREWRTGPKRFLGSKKLCFLNSLSIFIAISGTESGVVPESIKVRQLWLDIKSWEDVSPFYTSRLLEAYVYFIKIMSQESERFTGDTVLEWQEKLQKISKQVQCLTFC